MGSSSDFFRKNLERIREAIDWHDGGGCPGEIIEIRFHPHDFEKLDVETLWGIPVVAKDHVQIGFFRLKCSIEGDPTDPEERDEQAGTDQPEEVHAVSDESERLKV